MRKKYMFYYDYLIFALNRCRQLNILTSIHIYTQGGQNREKGKKYLGIFFRRGNMYMYILFRPISFHIHFQNVVKANTFLLLNVGLIGHSVHIQGHINPKHAIKQMKLHLFGKKSCFRWVGFNKGFTR